MRTISLESWVSVAARESPRPSEVVVATRPVCRRRHVRRARVSDGNCAPRPREVEAHGRDEGPGVGTFAPVAATIGSGVAWCAAPARLSPGPARGSRTAFVGAMGIGLLAALFFSVSFVLNRRMDLGGGAWER